MTIKVERRDVGHGKYQWFIDGNETDMEEPELIQWIEAHGFACKQSLWSQWNMSHRIYLELPDIDVDLDDGLAI
jgi:hypothetical protein